VAAPPTDNAVSYLGLAVAAFQLVLGMDTGGQISTTTTRDWTARFLDLPLGMLLVIVAGLVVVGVGGFLIYRTYTGSFSKIALGLIAFGAYAFVEARYRRIATA